MWWLSAQVTQVDLLFEFLIFAVGIALCHGAPPLVRLVRCAAGRLAGLCVALRLTRLQAELFAVDLPVAAVRGDQFLVRAALHDAPVLEHEDQVAVLDRRDAVRDRHNGLRAFSKRRAACNAAGRTDAGWQTGNAAAS